MFGEGKELARRVEERTGLQMDYRGRRELAKIGGSVVLGGVKVDGSEALETKSMQSVSNVVDWARDLAGDDPVKLNLLLQRAVRYDRRLDRAQSNIFGAL